MELVFEKKEYTEIGWYQPERPANQKQYAQKYVLRYQPKYTFTNQNNALGMEFVLEYVVLGIYQPK